MKNYESLTTLGNFTFEDKAYSLKDGVTVDQAMYRLGELEEKIRNGQLIENPYVFFFKGFIRGDEFGKTEPLNRYCGIKVIDANTDHPSVVARESVEKDMTEEKFKMLINQEDE